MITTYIPHNPMVHVLLKYINELKKMLAKRQATPYNISLDGQCSGLAREMGGRLARDASIGVKGVSMLCY